MRYMQIRVLQHEDKVCAITFVVDHYTTRTYIYPTKSSRERLMRILEGKPAKALLGKSWVGFEVDNVSQ